MQLQYELATILRAYCNRMKGRWWISTWNGTFLFTGIENCVSSSPDVLPVPLCPGQGLPGLGGSNHLRAKYKLLITRVGSCARPRLYHCWPGHCQNCNSMEIHTLMSTYYCTTPRLSPRPKPHLQGKF